MLAIRQDWLNCVALHLQYALGLFPKFWDIGSLNSLLWYPWALLCVSPSVSLHIPSEYWHTQTSPVLSCSRLFLLPYLCVMWLSSDIGHSWLLESLPLPPLPVFYEIIKTELGCWNFLCLCTQIVQKENTQKPETTEVIYLFNLKWLMFVIIFRIISIDQNCLEYQYIFTLTMNSKGKTLMNLQYQKPLWGSRNSR